MKLAIKTLLLTFLLQSCQGQKSQNEINSISKNQKIEVIESNKTNNENKSEILKVEITYLEDINLENSEFKNFPEAIKKKIKEMQSTNPLYFKLLADKNNSTYNLFNSNTSKEESFEKNTSKITIATTNTYKNIDNQLLLNTTSFNKIDYLISDKLTDFNWKITKEKMKIGKFNCIKATSLNNGNFLTAWFTEEIPLNDGPSIYWGLPGIIIKLTAQEKIFTAVQIQIKDNVIIKKPTVGKKMTQKEFKDFMKKQPKEITTEESSEY